MDGIGLLRVFCLLREVTLWTSGDIWVKQRSPLVPSRVHSRLKACSYNLSTFRAFHYASFAMLYLKAESHVTTSIIADVD
jgi:hypothetical protein